MIADQLDRALKAAGLPIVGVSIGDPIDRSTWQIQWPPITTKEDKAAASAILAAFVPLDEPPPSTITTDELLAYLAKKLGVPLEVARAEIAAEKVDPMPSGLK